MRKRTRWLPMQRPSQQVRMNVELPRYPVIATRQYLAGATGASPPTNYQEAFSPMERLIMPAQISNLLWRQMMGHHRDTKTLVSIQLAQMTLLPQHHVTLWRPADTSSLYHAPYASCAAHITIQAAGGLTERCLAASPPGEHDLTRYTDDRPAPGPYSLPQYDQTVSPWLPRSSNRISPARS